MIALAALLACAGPGALPPVPPDAARVSGHASDAGAWEDLALLAGDDVVCDWIWRVDEDPSLADPCADDDGDPCDVAVVGDLTDGRDPLGGCWRYGYTAARAGDGGPLGVGWTDAWHTAGNDQGPRLTWWDGARWIPVDPGDSAWDPETGELAWHLPAALPE